MLMKQNQLRLWTVIAVLAAALLFGACSQPTDELGSAVTLTAGSAQNVDYTDTSTAISFTGSNIPDLTAADFSIAPAGNGVEIADVTVNAEKTSVSVGAIFPANSAVSAVVYTITVAPGNKKVKASSGVAITQAGGPAVVSDLDLSGLFAAPVASAAPDTAFDSTQYSGSIAWETAAGDPAGSKFDYSTGYKAVIILSTNPGYILDGLSNGTGVFSYTGAVSVNYDNTFGKVTIGFAATSDPHVISGSLFGSWMTIVGQKVPVPILAGKTYELGLSYKGDMAFSTDTWAGYGLYVNIGVFDGVNSTIGAYDRYFAPEGSSDWTEESETFSYDDTHDDCFLFIAQGPDSSDNIISIREVFLYNITDDPGRTNNLLTDYKFGDADNISKFTGDLVGGEGNQFILQMLDKGTGWVLLDNWNTD